MSRKRSVSMRDVAVLAQVSIGTVSNVLNSPHRVAPQTRQRVEDAIEKLGWVPNQSARTLRAGRSNAIGMVVIDIANPFFAAVAKAVEEALYGVGMSVSLGNSDRDSEREQMLLSRMETERVGGVVCSPISDGGQGVRQLRRRGIPVVLVDRIGLGNDFCSVGADDLAGGQLAAQHLIDQGHHRLAFVGGPRSVQQVYDRRRGMELALQQAGEDYSLLDVATDDLSLKEGIRAAAELVSLPGDARPTAVFAANDLLAIGLLQGFVTAGWRVPEDMAIIGYDDIEFAAAAAVPLSSIRQPREEIGRRSVELLLAEIDAAEQGVTHQHQAVRYTPQLVVRRSTQLDAS